MISNNNNLGNDGLRNVIDNASITFRYTDDNDEIREIDLGTIQRNDNVDITPNNVSSTLDFNEMTVGSLLIPAHTTVPSSIGTGQITNISTNIPTQWETVSGIQIANVDNRLSELMEDYIQNRNQEDKLFINHNTCKRKIEYNSIDAIIEFREYLDNIIKQHYQKI